MELSESQRNDLMEFQSLQQQLQVVVMQKQQLQMASAEIDRALEASSTSTGKLYRSVGSILVQKEPDVLKKELSSEKEMVKLRVDSLGKQEEKLKTRLTEIQDKFEKSMPDAGKRK